MSTTSTDVRGAITEESAEFARLEIVAEHMKELLRDAYRKLVTVEELIELEDLTQALEREDKFGRHPGCVHALKVFLNEMRNTEAEPIASAAEAAVDLQAQFNAAEMNDRDTRAYTNGQTEAPR